MAETKSDITRTEYINDMLGSDSVGSEKHKEAIKQTLDIRKFEIELYWKRAAYFWAFIAFAFAGYFALTTAESRNPESELLMSCVGFVFSIAWYCVNRGSKAWQRNWEAHLDLLEDEITGPLYKTMINRYSLKFSKLTDAYFFSPTRINHLLNLFLIFIWGIIFLQSASNIFEIQIAEKYLVNFSVYAVLVVTLFTIFSFFWSGRTSDRSDKVKSIQTTVRKYKDTEE